MFFQSILIDTNGQGVELKDIGPYLPSPIQHLASENHPDTLIIQKDTPSLGIEHVRELINWNSLKPYQGDYKLGIIWDGHKLTSEAQNTLLKTIEEPAQFTQLVIITHNISSLLPTIRSRSTYIDIGNLDNNLANSGEFEKLAKNFLSPDFLTRLDTANIIIDKHSDKQNQKAILTLIMQEIINTTKTKGQSPKLNQMLEICKSAYTAINQGGNSKLTWQTLAITME